MSALDTVIGVIDAPADHLHEIHSYDDDGRRLIFWVPVDEPHALHAYVRMLGSRGLELSAVPRRDTHRDAIGFSHCLWAVLETTKSARLLLHFQPRPTIVLRIGASVKRVAFWALDEALSFEQTKAANQKLSFALKCPRRGTDPRMMFAPPETAVGAHKVGSWETAGLYSSHDVVGHLPRPREWRAGKVA